MTGDHFIGLFRPAVAYSLLAVAAFGYSLVAVALALAGAQAMPEPYLPIDTRQYLRWGAVFYAPVILAAWRLASGVVFVLARTVHRRS